MIKKILAALVICSAILLSCAPELVPDEPSVELPSEDPEEKPQEKPDEGPEEKPGDQLAAGQINDPGIAYVWDESVIPEITIHIAKEEWNRLLKRYDEFSQNVDYFHADFTYKKGDDVHFIEDGGVRLRGNTSRRRPEGNGGQLHDPSAPDWHHCHFGINFRKFHKDNEHTIYGIRKVNLNGSRMTLVMCVNSIVMISSGDMGYGRLPTMCIAVCGLM